MLDEQLRTEDYTQKEVESYNDFMEGVNPMDYCQCGLPLHEVITMPDGTKRNVAHTVDSVEHKIT